MSTTKLIEDISNEIGAIPYSIERFDDGNYYVEWRIDPEGELNTTLIIHSSPNSPDLVAVAALCCRADDEIHEHWHESMNSVSVNDAITVASIKWRLLKHAISKDSRHIATVKSVRALVDKQRD